MEDNDRSSNSPKTVSRNENSTPAPYMSPYRTRLRANSTLTEENVEMHNTSIPKRVTRRKSQGSDSLQLTPMPIVRRSKRTASLKSEENAINKGLKEKFSEMESSTLAEEEELFDSDKNSPSPVTHNGSVSSKLVAKVTLTDIGKSPGTSPGTSPGKSPGKSPRKSPGTSPVKKEGKPVDDNDGKSSKQSLDGEQLPNENHASSISDSIVTVPSTDSSTNKSNLKSEVLGAADENLVKDGSNEITSNEMIVDRTADNDSSMKEKDSTTIENKEENIHEQENITDEKKNENTLTEAVKANEILVETPSAINESFATAVPETVIPQLIHSDVIDSDHTQPRKSNQLEEDIESKDIDLSTTSPKKMNEASDKNNSNIDLNESHFDNSDKDFTNSADSSVTETSNTDTAHRDIDMPEISRMDESDEPKTKSKGENINTNSEIDEKEDNGTVIFRKSDGRPIDAFGLSTSNKTTDNSEPLHTVSSKQKNTSDDDDESEEENRDRNSFIDDEAEETNGEDSMSEEERKYIEENEIEEGHISLGSTDTDDQDDDNEDNLSFVVSDSPISLLEGSENDLSIEEDTKNVRKPKKKRRIIIGDSEDEEAEDLDKSKITNSEENNGHDTEKSKRETSKSSHSDVELSSSDKNSDSTMEIYDMEVNASPEKRKSQQKNQIIDDTSEDEANTLDKIKDIDPRQNASSKRMSLNVSEKPKNTKKRMSLHPNTQLNSTSNLSEKQEGLSSSGENADSLMETEAIKHDFSSETDVSQQKNIDPDEDETNALKKLKDVDPKQNIIDVPKRMSLNITKETKETKKRMSLHPDFHLNSKSNSHDTQTTNESMETDYGENVLLGSCSSIAEEKDEVSGDLAVSSDSSSIKNAKSNKIDVTTYDNVMNYCYNYLTTTNEAKRNEKLGKTKTLEDEKLLKIREKKAMKLQAKKEKVMKETELIERLKRQKEQSKKSKKQNEVTDDDHQKEIAKAVNFRNFLLNQQEHSVNGAKCTNANIGKRNYSESSNDEVSISKPKVKKRKMLNILMEAQSVKKQEIRENSTTQMEAKPKGFIVQSKSMANVKKREKQKKKKQISESRKLPQPVWTASGNFTVVPLDFTVRESVATKFKVTNLNSKSASPSTVYNKDKIQSTSKVSRETAVQSQSRKIKKSRKG